MEELDLHQQVVKARRVDVSYEKLDYILFVLGCKPMFAYKEIKP